MYNVIDTEIYRFQQFLYTILSFQETDILYCSYISIIPNMKHIYVIYIWGM